MPEPPALRSLCIVSSDPVRSGELLAALRTVVDSHEGLEIVVDRRRCESGRAPGSPSDDRRRQPFVDVKVKTDGFAIVPSPSEAEPDRPELPLLEADPEQLVGARVLDFGRRSAVRRRRLVLASCVGAALVVLALVPAMATFTSWTRSAAPLPAESPAAIATAPPPRPSAPATPSGGSPQRSESRRLESTRPEPTSQVVERTDRPKEQARPPAAEPAAQPRARVATAPMAVQGPRPTAPPPVAAQPVPPQPVAPPPVPPQPVTPPAAAQPPVAPSPSEVTSRPEPPTQAAKAAEAPAPRPQPSASTQPNGPVQSPEPARVREAAPANQAPARSPEAAPARQTPVRPHEAAPARQVPVRRPDAAPPRQALGRPSDASPARQAPTATIPDVPPASGGGSASDYRGGFGDQFKNLGTVIERDLIEATADVRRQGDDFKALQDRFLRAWDGLKQSFGGSAEK